MSDSQQRPPQQRPPQQRPPPRALPGVQSSSNRPAPRRLPGMPRPAPRPLSHHLRPAPRPLPPRPNPQQPRRPAPRPLPGTSSPRPNGSGAGGDDRFENGDYSKYSLPQKHPLEHDARDLHPLTGQLISKSGGSEEIDPQTGQVIRRRGYRLQLGERFAEDLHPLTGQPIRKGGQRTVRILGSGNTDPPNLPRMIDRAGIEPTADWDPDFDIPEDDEEDMVLRWEDYYIYVPALGDTDQNIQVYRLFENGQMEPVQLLPPAGLRRVLMNRLHRLIDHINRWIDALNNLLATVEPSSNMHNMIIMRLSHLTNYTWHIQRCVTALLGRRDNAYHIHMTPGIIAGLVASDRISHYRSKMLFFGVTPAAYDRNNADILPQGNPEFDYGLQLFFLHQQALLARPLQTRDGMGPFRYIAVDPWHRSTFINEYGYAYETARSTADPNIVEQRLTARLRNLAEQFDVLINFL
jgi:hypothetical protein